MPPTSNISPAHSSVPRECLSASVISHFLFLCFRSTLVSATKPVTYYHQPRKYLSVSFMSQLPVSLFQVNSGQCHTTSNISPAHSSTVLSPENICLFHSCLTLCFDVSGQLRSVPPTSNISPAHRSVPRECLSASFMPNLLLLCFRSTPVNATRPVTYHQHTVLSPENGLSSKKMNRPKTAAAVLGMTRE